MRPSNPKSPPAAESPAPTLLDFDAPHLRVLDAVLRASSDTIVVMNRAENYLYASITAANALGITPETMLGKTMRDFDASPELNARLTRLREQVFATGQPISGEATIATVAGLCDFEFTFSPVQDANGQIQAILCIGRDISERKRSEHAQEALYQQATRQAAELRSVIDSISDAVYIGQETGITVCNQPALDMLGFTSLEELNQKIAILNERLQNRDAATGERIPPEDEASVHALHGRKMVREVVARNLQSGQDVVVRSAAAPIVQDGVIIGAVAVNTDITRQKEIEAELRAGEARFRAVFENTAVGVALVTPDGRIFQSNPALRRMLGYSEEELAAMAYPQFTHPDDLEADRALAQEVHRGQRDTYAIEKRYIRKDGSLLWAHMSISAVRNAGGSLQFLVAVINDITAREEAQAERTRLASYNLLLLESTSEGIVGVDIEGRCTFINRAGAEMLGYTPEELQGQFMHSLVHHSRPDGSPYPQSECPIYLAFREGTKCRVEGEVFWRKDGTPVPVMYAAAPILEEHGAEGHKIVGTVMTYSDLTDRRRQEQERHYVMAAARCLLWYADVYDTGHPDYLGWDIHVTDEEAAQRFLPLELLEGEDYKDAKYRLRLPEDREACDRLGTTSIRAGKSYIQEFRCQCADGTLHWLREDVQVETIEPGKHWRVVVVCTDVTEQKRLEQQFLQSQKMESIGRLAGGIAHDFNNLLSVILGYAEMVETELAEDSDLLPNIQNIQSAASRAAKLTSQLLAFARKQVSEAKVLSPNDLIRNMGKILKPLIREDIELDMLLTEEVGSIRADSTQIEQVIVNLVVNARDAMPHGGKVLLHTKNVTLDSPYLHEETAVQPGEYVLIAVSDTGMGMTPEVKSRLFEPFFTTKDVGKGTGLGLATVYGIVKQSSGYVFVYSEEGFGTTVKVYLPRVDAVVSATKSTTHAGASLHGSETVLVVEDERLVRDLTVSTLRRSGYEVLQAENGQDALRVVEEFAKPIHLVVTDAIMPVMGGKELADRLRVIRPSTQVMYVSGYTEEVTSIQGILPEGTAFLQKPFTAKALLTGVRAVLDNTSDNAEA